MASSKLIEIVKARTTLEGLTREGCKALLSPQRITRTEQLLDTVEFSTGLICLAKMKK